MTGPEKGHPGPACVFELEQDGGFTYSRIDGVPKKIERLGLAKSHTRQFLDYAHGLISRQVTQGEHLSRDLELLQIQLFGPQDGKWVERCPTSLCVKQCAENIEMRMWPGKDYYELSPYFCKRHLLCMACAIQRGSRQLSRASERIRRLDGGERLHWYMLTMTVKDGESLEERYDHLTRSLGFVMRVRRRGHGRSCFGLLDGGMFSYEFKRGQGSGRWHPHVHMIVVSEQELPLRMTCSDGRFVGRWPDLEREWLDVTGDSFIVECHPVDFGGDRGLFGPLCEVFKYAVKVGQLAHEDRITAEPVAM